jgi:subtilase family serine protease
MNRSGKVRVVAFLRGAQVALCSAMLLFLFSIVTRAQNMPTRHVRQDVVSGRAQFLNQLPASQTMRLDVVLPLRDPEGLESFLKELYDPASPSYRHFLTVAEFTAKFGPTQADYDAVIRFAGANGFTVVGGTRDGMDVQIEGTVANIEKAFHLNMGVYQHPTESRTFYAPDREPTTDLPFALWHVSGLDDYSIPHPMFVKRSDYAKAHGIDAKDVVSHATTGSGPSASFLGSDMRAAYYGGTALTGAGQNLGLFEYLGTDLADLNTYFANVGQTNNVPITLLSTDGTSTSCVDSRAGGDCDDTEQTLDMTQAIGMAPGLASLVMYIGSTDTAIISAMTTHNPLPTTIGCSWGWTPADPSTLNPYFQKMAAQGQNFFVASGDSSTWSASNEAWPADNAYIVSVGGTDLVTASAAGPWKSETAWSDSGGGISPDSIPIPSWQQLSGVINSSNKGSTTLRNGPDVSANANFTFYTCADQTTCLANEYGGTSFAAPMWAGYIALVNQQLAENSQPTIGFLNPTIYAENITSAYSTDFHDITSGTSGSYSAVVGYDLVTGWGSPNGTGLINALAAPVSTTPGFSITTSPASVSVVQGNSGSSTVTTTVSGGFDSAVTLSASGQPSGVTVNFSTSTIAAPGSGSSTVTLAVAATTATGTYPITITATGGGITHTATISLSVTAPVTGGFTISVSPSSGYLDQGQSGYAVVTTTVTGNFSSAVSLNASGVPSGVTVSFSPASIGAPGSGTSDMLLTVSRNAPTGTYPITIKGTGGGVTQTTVLTFEIVSRRVR